MSPRKSKPAAAPAPKKQSAGYEKKKTREVVRQREQSHKDRDIAPLPDVVNPKRRAAAVKSFRKFCESYFPLRFNMAWSPDHLEVLTDFQRIVTGGGVLALAMPRGSGKTSLAEVSVLWAILCQGHRFVMLIAASKTKAKELLASVATELEYNDLLMEDFPEVCYPVRQLEGVNQRKPLFNGERIVVQVGKTQVLLPALPGSGFAGGVIRCGGLKGSDIRGASYLQPDGTRLRPSYFVADDPQTDASAKSDLQNEERELLLSGAVLGMAGPGKAIAGVVPCTVIRPNDMADRILNREIHPEYGGRRYRMLTRIAPDKDLGPWRKYGDVRSEGLRAGDGGKAGNAHWKTHRKELESLAQAAWPARHKPDELSAVQSAVNLWLADRRAFFAEYQNDPDAGIVTETRKLDPKELARRLSGRERGLVPISVQFLAGGIDCHADLLYWAAVAGEEVQTGYVTDYGTWPDQRSRYFAKRDASPTIEKALHDRDKVERDVKAQLYAALDTLTTQMFERDFPREEGAGSIRIGKIVIDAGYLPDVVFRFCRESKYSAMLFPTQGVGKQKMPNPNTRPKGGAYWGEDYYVPAPGRRPVRYAIVDGAAWIQKTHNAFLAPKGAAGAWLLFDAPAADHRCYVDHICSESPIDKREPDGRIVRTYQLKPGADNHWLDTTKLAGIGLRELGCKSAFETMGGPPKKPARREPKVSYH